MMKKNARLLLIVSLVLCLLSMTGTSLIASDFSKVSITDISIRTPVGALTGQLFVPNSVSATNKAPAIIVSHGSSANEDFVESWSNELARRGYVVFTPNLYQHGDSPAVSSKYSDTESYKTDGLYDAVEYVYTLPCVDNTRIGITGHSLGGGDALTTATYYSSLESTALKNGVTPQAAHALNKIAAVLPVSYALEFKPDFNIAGVQSYDFNGLLCNVGVILGKADDFQSWMDNGFLSSQFGKNWLASQTGITAPSGGVTQGQFYTNPQNGYCFVAWNPPGTHNMPLISPSAVQHVLQFFDHSLGAPVQMSDSNQIWIIKKILELLGIIGIFMFLLPCAYCLSKMPVFTKAKTGEQAVSAAFATPKEKRRFIRSLIGGAAINTIMLVPLILIGSIAMVGAIWPQSSTNGFALWGFVGGLVTLWMVRIGMGTKLKGHGEELGTKINKRQFSATLLLGCIVVGATFLIVFAAKYFFNAHFMFWNYDIRAFGVGRVTQALRYIPLFAVFQIGYAVSIYRNNFEGWSDRKRIWFSTLVGLAPIIIMILITYVPIFFIGAPLWGQSGKNLLLLAMANGAIKLPGLIIPVAIMSIINVKLQKITGNIWLGAIINTLMITMIAVANCNSIISY